MPLRAFSFPFPESRFFRAGNFIYKFKIRAGGSYSGEEVPDWESCSEDLEEIVRTVLANLDSLQPFTCRSFVIYPYKRRWEGSNVLGKYGGKGYPFMLILYLEKNVQKGLQAEEKLNSCVLQNEKVAQQILAAPELQSKRCRRDSPLEDAILKKLKKDLEAEGEVSVVSRLQLNNPEKEEEHQEDQGHADKRAKMADEPQRSETPGEERQDLDEEGGGEEVEDEDSTPHPPARPGIWTRLASYIFPVRLFFRDP